MIALLVAILIVALVLYAVQLLPFDAALVRILQIVVVVIAIVWLLQRFAVV